MRKSRWRREHVAAATLVGAVSGVAFGLALAPADSPAPTADREPRVGLASGVARLPLPAGWEPVGRRSSLPGLRAATAVRGIDSAVALDIRAPENPSLLAADVIAASGEEPPRPQLRRLSGRAVWRYELPGGEPWLRMVAMTLPTTEGVVTIACEAATVALAGGDCERAMSVLRVSGASELAPAPETAARIALPAALARLNGERRKHRRALAATRSAPERSRTARRLARAYRTAAARLRPLAAGDARRLAGALARLAHDHRSLALATRRRDAAAAARAGGAIERGERRVAALLRAVSRASGAARND